VVAGGGVVDDLSEGAVAAAGQDADVVHHHSELRVHLAGGDDVVQAVVIEVADGDVLRAAGVGGGEVLGAGGVFDERREGDGAEQAAGLEGLCASAVGGHGCSSTVRDGGRTAQGFQVIPPYYDILSIWR